MFGFETIAKLDNWVDTFGPITIAKDPTTGGLVLNFDRGWGWMFAKPGKNGEPEFGYVRSVPNEW